MLSKLQAVEDRYLDLENKISDPDVIARQDEWQKYTKEHARLTELVEKFRAYKRILADLAGAQTLLREETDPEMLALAQSEFAAAKKKIGAAEQELKILLLPKDETDEKNAILEIRGGAGGDEAALFAGDLIRMYSRYAESEGWRVEFMDANPTGIGGFKEVIVMIYGNGAYGRLKYESGVHRVQRVPETESSGRIHTSTVTVAVLPEAEEVDVEINPGDLRIDTYCASGAGGQYVNKTESAVRITHLPTGIVVQCQDEKSQLQNREKCMRVLRAKLLEAAREGQRAAVAESRKSQVGTGDRSERIRTYNFPQGRVTDHRIGLTLHKLEAVLNGGLKELTDALAAAAQSERLKQAQ
ncbi:MAG: peptide chain release factor 1 [Acidaminococcales bacterium]|jgi:peptide chain release factor 1|nr:peptide chain release factor 1 [Acidaminococcales bacterium]